MGTAFSWINLFLLFATYSTSWVTAVDRNDEFTPKTERLTSETTTDEKETLYDDEAPSFWDFDHMDREAQFRVIQHVHDLHKVGAHVDWDKHRDNYLLALYDSESNQRHRHLKKRSQRQRQKSPRRRQRGGPRGRNPGWTVSSAEDIQAGVNNTIAKLRKGTSGGNNDNNNEARVRKSGSGNGDRQGDAKQKKAKKAEDMDKEKKRQRQRDGPRGWNRGGGNGKPISLGGRNGGGGGGRTKRTNRGSKIPKRVTGSKRTRGSIINDDNSNNDVDTRLSSGATDTTFPPSTSSSPSVSFAPSTSVSPSVNPTVAPVTPVFLPVAAPVGKPVFAPIMSPTVGNGAIFGASSEREPEIIESGTAPTEDLEETNVTARQGFNDDQIVITDDRIDFPIYEYSLGNCPGDGDSPRAVPCAPDNIDDICDKYVEGSSFSACFEACRPSFCCIHDAPPETNLIAPNCNTDVNCAQYACCYIVWWKLHDTIGPATQLRVEQTDDFYDVEANFVEGDVTNIEFYREMLFHHFDDSQEIIRLGTVQVNDSLAVFNSDLIFLNSTYWDTDVRRRRRLREGHAKGKQ